MEVETLGVAKSLGWKVHMRCANGYRRKLVVRISTLGTRLGAVIGGPDATRVPRGRANFSICQEPPSDQIVASIYRTNQIFGIQLSVAGTRISLS